MFIRFHNNKKCVTLYLIVPVFKKIEWQKVRTLRMQNHLNFYLSNGLKDRYLYRIDSIKTYWRKLLTVCMLYSSCTNEH